MSYCKVVLVGRLGADPDAFNGGCRLSVAVSERFKDKSGQRQERTEWNRVAVFGPQAEPCMKYLQKGKEVLVEGTLRTSSYEKSGQKHYATDIIADRVVFLGGGGGQSERRPAPTTAPAAPSDDDDDVKF